MAKRRQKHRGASEPGFEPVANPELAKWMHALRSSSAAERHTPTPRKGTRCERERQAIRDQFRGDHS